eukprot:TRINITY_DN6317_c2_g1_i1.p1 TRINITY_DN6317_c2_g1~~TRINITY_DN6317_c2_g1_i1.p1  ORF type:complete len:385 (+),score=60.32 TRINITY_DN6317_c2_g1_i1:59-1156(+)
MLKTLAFLGAMCTTASSSDVKGLALGSPGSCGAMQYEEEGPWVLRNCTGNTINIMWARMWNSTHGYAYSTDTAILNDGISFRRTHDSGETWEVVYRLSPFEAYTDLDWKDWSTALATGWTKINGQASSTPMLLRTGNGGDSWKPATITGQLPSGYAVHAMAVAWYVGDKALAGGYIRSENQSVSFGILYQTLDAGLTFNCWVNPSVALIDHIHPVTSTQLWFGGVSRDNMAAIWRTADEGQTLLRELIVNNELFTGSAAFQVNMKNNGTAAIAGRAIVGNHDAMLRYFPDEHKWVPDYSSFHYNEQVHMCYNNHDGTFSVAAGATNTLYQPFIKQWSSSTNLWVTSILTTNLTSPQSFRTIYLFY